MTGNPNQPRASAVSVTETGHRVAIALGEAREGRLEFANGVARLTIRNADPMDDILRARFQGWPPRVRLDDGAIVMRYPRRFKPFEWRRRKAQVELNPSVPWEIVIRGGASGVRADLRSFELRAVLIGGGASDVELLLPEPTRPVDVRIGGGASKVRIVRPRKVPARLQVAHGSSKLAFDDEAFGAVGGRLRLLSHGFDEAIGGRYDVVVGGGASRLSVASE